MTSSCFHVCDDIRNMTEGTAPDSVKWHVRMNIDKLRTYLYDAVVFHLYDNA